MRALVMLLWLQAALQNGGVVSGVIRSADGNPLTSAPVYAIHTSEIPPGVAGSRRPLGETDESGRYRIEVPAGRYYIASGPEDSLIYAPGVSEVSASLPVTVTPGLTLEAVNLTVGVLSGTIRQNGKPAVGATVNAIPVSTLAAITAASRIASTGENRAGWTSFMRLTIAGRAGDSSKPTDVPGTMLQTFADHEGRYRIEGVPAETYYIVAGWAEAAIFYPGAQTAAAATAVAMTPATARGGLDFEIPAEPAGVAVAGRLNTNWGNLVDGIPVMLKRREPERFELGLPSWTDLNAPALVRAAAEGRFAFDNVRPGVYSTGMLVDGNPEFFAELVVGDRPVKDFAPEIPYALVSVRVLFEDGTFFWGPELFRELILTSGDVATPLPIPPGGVLTRLMPPGDYRVSVRTVPPDYRIRLVTSDGKDLSTAPLNLTLKPAVRIEIRVARK